MSYEFLKQLSFLTEGDLYVKNKSHAVLSSLQHLTAFLNVSIVHKCCKYNVLVFSNKQV